MARAQQTRRQPVLPRAAPAGGAWARWAAPRLFWPAAAAIVGALIVVYRLIWPVETAFVTAFDHGDRVFADFIRHYYPQACGLLATHAPVTGYFYSAFFAVALLPFGWPPLATALGAWGALQVAAALALCALPARRLLRETGSAELPMLYIFAFASAHPVLHNFVWGQVSVFVTLAIVAAACAHADGRRVPAAGLVALAAAVKYYPGIVAAQFALRRDWRALGVCAAVAVALLVVVPAVVLGPGDALRFQQIANGAVQGSRWIARDPNSQYFAHVAQRLTGAAGPGAWPIVGWLVAAGSGALLWRERRGRGARDPLFGPIVLLLAVPFVLRTSWPHYFVYLPFCQVFLLRAVLTDVPARWTRRMLAGLVLVSLALGNVGCFLVVGSWETYSRLGFLLWSDALLLAAAWGLVAAGRAREEHT